MSLCTTYFQIGLPILPFRFFFSCKISQIIIKNNILKLMQEAVVHYILRKENALKIQYQVEKKTLNLSVIMKKYPASEFVFQIRPEPIQEDATSLKRALCRYRTLHIPSLPKTASLLLEKKIEEVSCKNPTDISDVERKYLHEARQEITFGIKSWGRMQGRLQAKVDLHPHERVVYISVLSRGEDLRAASTIISLARLTGKHSPLREHSSQDEMLQTFFRILTESKQFLMQWQRKTLKTSKLLNEIKLTNVIIIHKIKQQDQELSFSHNKIQIFKHVFPTELISHIIINQFARSLHRKAKYRDGVEKQEYQDEGLEELRRWGHRFSSFRDYPFKHKKLKYKQTIRQDKSDSDDHYEDDDDEEGEEQSEEQSDSQSERQNKINQKQMQTKRKTQNPEKKTKMQKIKEKIKNKKEICNFTFISGKDKARFNKRRYCLHQMARETDKNQASIDFLLLVSSIVPKQERISNKIGSKSLVGNFMSQFKVKRDINVCFAEYTKNSFFHQILNLGLRVLQDPYELMYLRLPFSHLFWSIKSIYHRHKRVLFDKSKQKHKSLKIFLFRGLEMSEKEIKRMSKNVGGFIETEGFLSTSLSESVVDAFVVNVKMVIEVKVINMQGMHDHGFANISGFSEYQREKEVLVNAFNVFKIASFHLQIFTDDIEVYILRLEHGSIKKIEEKIKKSENLLDAQYAWVQNHKEYYKSKDQLEIHKKKISDQMYNKLSILLPKAVEQLQKRKKFLKEWEAEEYLKSVQKLEKWQKELIMNIDSSQPFLQDIDNYGELLYHLSYYRRAEVYFRRKLKALESDLAIEGHDWWKSVRLVRNSIRNRLFLYRCYKALARPQDSLHHAEKLLGVRTSLGVPQSDPRYYEVLFDMYIICLLQLFESEKQKKYKQKFLKIVSKYELKDTSEYKILMRIQEIKTDHQKDKGKEVSKQQEEKEKIVRKKEKKKMEQQLKHIELQFLGKYSGSYLEKLQYLMETMTMYRWGEEEEALQAELSYLYIRKKVVHAEYRPHTCCVFREVLRSLKQIHFYKDMYLLFDCLSYCWQTQWWRAFRPVVSKLSKTKVQFRFQSSLFHMFVLHLYVLLLLSVSQQSLIQDYLTWVRVFYQQQGQTNNEVYKTMISHVLDLNQDYQESSLFKFFLAHFSILLSLSVFRIYYHQFFILSLATTFIQKKQNTKWRGMPNSFNKSLQNVIRERWKDYRNSRIITLIVEGRQSGRVLWKQMSWEKKKGEVIPWQCPFYPHTHNQFYTYLGMSQYLLQGELNLLMHHLLQFKNMYCSILNLRRTNDYLHRLRTVTKLHLSENGLEIFQNYWSSSPLNFRQFI